MARKDDPLRATFTALARLRSQNDVIYTARGPRHSQFLFCAGPSLHPSLRSPIRPITRVRVEKQKKIRTHTLSTQLCCKTIGESFSYPLALGAHFQAPRLSVPRKVITARRACAQHEYIFGTLSLSAGSKRGKKFLRLTPAGLTRNFCMRYTRDARAPQTHHKSLRVFFTLQSLGLIG